MPKYWGKQIFTHRRFPEVGQKQKTGRKEKIRLNDGVTHGARNPPGPKSAGNCHYIATLYKAKTCSLCTSHDEESSFSYVNTDTFSFYC